MLEASLPAMERKKLARMKRHIDWLSFEVRPLRAVLEHLIKDENISSDVTHYLEDVEDHLINLLDLLSAQSSACDNLRDEYNTYSDRRMNVLLYFLTIVTVLLVPFQMATGYYGMNFKDFEGQMLFNDKIGIANFWIFTCTGTVGIIIMLVRKGVILSIFFSRGSTG